MNPKPITQAIVCALIGLAVFATLVFKTGLQRSDRMGVEAVTVRQIEPQSERTPKLEMTGTSHVLLLLESTNKPAVRWSELTEVGEITNTPICK